MYSTDFRRRCLERLDANGGLVSLTARQMGVSASAVSGWSRDRGRAMRPKEYVYLAYGEKRALVDRLAAGERAGDLAAEAGVTPGAIYGWRRRLLEGGDLALMTKKEIASGAAGPPPADPAGDPAELAARVDELELRCAVLERTVEMLKKDPGADASSLTNGEKAAIAEALRGRFGLRAALSALGLARSTFYARLAAARRPDKYARLRPRVRELFEAKGRAWGSERIWALLRRPDDGGEPVRVSEKVVRRIMREEGLSPAYARRRRRRYSSYAGEIGDAPPNLVARSFRADAPSRLWLTDVTQFSLPSFRCYLSPVIDCFDGKVVAHRASLSPDAALTESMLGDARASVPEGAPLGPADAPVVHSDRGCHYRWPGWARLCAEGGLVRSMSAKGCSPDNAACEGFFGRLKNEFFYHRDWEGVGSPEFSARLDAYIADYNEGRIKKSLGWMSPNQYRRSLGIAV